MALIDPGQTAHLMKSMNANRSLQTLDPEARGAEAQGAGHQGGKDHGELVSGHFT